MTNDAISASAAGNTNPSVSASPSDAGNAGQAVFQALDRVNQRPYTKREYAKRLLWNWVHATLFRCSPRRAFAWRAFLLRCFGARIGPHFAIRRTCNIVHPWLLETEQWVSLGENVEVYNLGLIRIGQHTSISQRVHLCAGTHDYANPSLPLVRATITIGSGVWVAAEAFVGPFVIIGDNSVVAARAVVVKEVPPGVVVGGNPAKVIKARPMTQPGTPPQQK